MPHTLKFMLSQWTFCECLLRQWQISEVEAGSGSRISDITTCVHVLVVVTFPVTHSSFTFPSLSSLLLWFSIICFLVTNQLRNGCVREHVPSCTWIREEVGWGEINFRKKSFSLIYNMFYKHNRKKLYIYIHFSFRVFFHEGNVKDKNAVNITDNSSGITFYSGLRKGIATVVENKTNILKIL